MQGDTASRIREYFLVHKEELVADLLELVEAESPTNDKNSADRCCDLLSEIIFKRLGVASERIPQETYGDHLRVRVGQGGRKMLLVGHYDTVWDVGAKPTSRNGNIIMGPGVFDMKYGIISAIWSLKAVSDLQLPFDKSVCLLFNSDEEVGSPTSKPIMLEQGEQYEAALILEPSHKGGIKTERKGVGMVEVKVKGVASHSGSDYEAGVSAIEEAAKIVTYLHSLTNLAEGTTVNVGLIDGGTRRNVVAAECKLGVDFRVRSAVACDKLMAAINSITPSREGLSVEISGELNRPPFERTEGNMALYRKLVEVASDMGMELFEIATGGGSDGNFTSYYGIATIDGMGAVGDGGHAESEYVDIDKSLERTMLLCAYWSEL